MVVFTTSKADTDIEKVCELGANSFVTKPAASEALVATMAKITGYWFEWSSCLRQCCHRMKDYLTIRVLAVEDDDEDFFHE